MQHSVAKTAQFTCNCNEIMCLQVKYYQNILTSWTNFVSESASSTIRGKYDNHSHPDTLLDQSISLVCPHLEYVFAVWDPFHKKYDDRLEWVQNLLWQLDWYT